MPRPREPTTAYKHCRPRIRMSAAFGVLPTVETSLAQNSPPEAPLAGTPPAGTQPDPVTATLRVELVGIPLDFLRDVFGSLTVPQDLAPLLERLAIELLAVTSDGRSENTREGTIDGLGRAASHADLLPEPASVPESAP